MEMTKENLDALKGGNLGLPGTYSPGQTGVSELQGPYLKGMRGIPAAWRTDDQSRPLFSMNIKD